MKKQFGTLDTLKILLAYPDIMYQSIERMDRVNDKFIEESALVFTVREHAKPLDSAEKQRLLNAFDTKNLHHANIVCDIVKRDDGRYLMFQESVVMIFRLCEASLYQEVTDAKLRSRLVSLRDARDRLNAASFVDDDSDYAELTDDISEQLSNLLAMLRNNIIAMQSIGEKLENLTADASKSPEEFPKYRQTMFEQTIRLFDRHIKPTLIFLDSSSHLADGTNLFDTISQIRSSYTTNDKHKVADQIFLYSMSLANVFTPVQEVGRQVDHFLRKTRVGMLQYNAIESRYQTLLSLYRETQTSNLKNVFMDTKGVEEFADLVPGLKLHRKPQAYQFGDSLAYYEKVFSEIELRLSLLEIDQPSIFEGSSYQDKQADVRLKRAQLLYQWLEVQPFRPTDDLVATLHYRLNDWLEGYRFTDLLTVIIRLTHKTNWDYQVVTNNKFHYITIGDDAFKYRQRKLLRTEAENV